MLTTQFLIHAFSILDYRYSCVNLIPSFPLISWFLFIFSVNACTCKPEPHHFDPIHVCLLVHATWFHLTYSLGCFLTTLDLHVQILKRSESVVESFWEPWDFFDEHRISRISFLTRLLDWLARFSLFSLWVFSIFLCCKSCFCASWWSNILRILYHALWKLCTCAIILKCKLPLCFRTLIPACTDA